jgi:hypothetical protein
LIWLNPLCKQRAAAWVDEPKPSPPGAFGQSGSEVLQCAERGVWVRRGEKRPG